MIAAVLAGGLGTRLRSIVADRPKALAEIYGRPFLTYLLDQLVEAGIREVVLCTGYMGEKIRLALGESYGSLHLAYSQEPSPLGTGGALRYALPLLESTTVLVMNGDSYCDVNLQKFWAWHDAQGAAATLVLTWVPDTGRYGRVELNGHGAVTGFNEKAAEGRPGWVNAGVYLLSARLLRRIPAQREVSMEREVFPTWAGRGLYGYQSDGRFLDIGTGENYAAAESFFALDRSR